MAQLRPSDISAWALCPARVKYKELQKDYPSLAMSQGSLLHARIEHHLARGHKFDWHSEYDDIIQQDTDGNVTIDDLPKKAVGGAIGLMESAYYSWKNSMLPMLEAFGDDIIVEHRLERPLGNHTMGGTPDLVIPDEKWIIDWKTAGRQWKDTKAAGELQPPAYTWLNGWESGKFTFAVVDLSTLEWKTHTVYVLPDQITAWLLLADAAGEAINNSNYPATPHGQGWTSRGWHCSPKYCSGWNPCLTKHLIADDKATEVRDPKAEWK